jgi:hypothetical protein
VKLLTSGTSAVDVGSSSQSCLWVLVQVRVHVVVNGRAAIQVGLGQLDRRNFALLKKRNKLGRVFAN